MIELTALLMRSWRKWAAGKFCSEQKEDTSLLTFIQLQVCRCQGATAHVGWNLSWRNVFPAQLEDSDSKPRLCLKSIKTTLLKLTVNWCFHGSWRWDTIQGCWCDFKPACTLAAVNYYHHLFAVVKEQHVISWSAACLLDHCSLLQHGSYFCSCCCHFNWS